MMMEGEKVSLDVQLLLLRADKLLANPKRIALLRQIDATGSIRQAAQVVGLSYKAAWDAVALMNDLADTAVVERVVGGKGGGGARLTVAGQRLVKMYALLEQVQTLALDALQDEQVPMDSLLSVLARGALQTSARNQWLGKVSAIESRELNDLLQIELSGGDILHAAITRSSRERMGLVVGQEVLALLKGPAVTLAPADQPVQRYNALHSRVTALARAARDTEVELSMAGGSSLCAVVPNEQADSLHLHVEQTVIATFSPRQVLIMALA